MVINIFLASLKTGQILQNKRPCARKLSGSHYLVFHGKAISKKSHCHKGSHFLVYENKVIFKKDLFIYGLPLLNVPKQCGL